MSGLLEALKASLAACDQAVSPPLQVEVGPIAPPRTMVVFCGWCMEMVEADVRAIVDDRAFVQCKCGRQIEDVYLKEEAV